MLLYYIIPSLSCFIILISTIFVLKLLYAAYCLHEVHKKFDHIPGPKRTSFWFGNLDYLMSESKKGIHLGDIFLNLAKKYGHTFKLILVSRPLIVSVDQETVKELLVSGKYKKSHKVYSSAGLVFGARCLGNGLVTVTDTETWHRKRNIMNPVFKKESIKELITKFNEAIDLLLVQLKHVGDGKTPACLMKEFSRTTLDTLGKVGFNREINSLQNNDCSFPAAIRNILEGMSMKSATPYVQYSPTYWSYRRKTRRSVELIRETGKKWIQERIDAINNGEVVPRDILTHITQMIDDDMNFSDILDEFCTFFIAGQETVSTATTFAVYYLCNNPQTLMKLTDEIDAVVGTKKVIDFNDIAQMSYLDMVWKETLRLNPPSIATIRVTGQDDSQVLGGYKLPPDSDVHLSSYVSSRLPEFNENPLDFIPERFASDSAIKPSIYTYYPFTLGPRICIGQQFAKIEGKMILTKLFQNFEVKLDPTNTFELVLESTLKFKEGLRCFLKQRQSQSFEE